MHDAGQACWCPVLRDEGQEVRPGVAVLEAGLHLFDGQFRSAAVNGDRLASRGGNGQLGDERGLLHFGIGVFGMIVVEANLADGKAAGVAREVFELLQGFGRGAVGFLRGDTGGGADLRRSGRALVLAGDLESPLHGVRAVADADG